MTGFPPVERKCLTFSVRNTNINFFGNCISPVIIIYSSGEINYTFIGLGDILPIDDRSVVYHYTLDLQTLTLGYFAYQDK